jgi:hypothetical protein
MDAQSVQARIEHETAQLRSLHPRISVCHTALVQWKDGDATRYSLHLDIRMPQHQTLLSGEARDTPEAAIEAAFKAAKERLK